MKQPYIGTHLAEIQLSSFVKHGIPVPSYIQDGGLMLLFKDSLECQNYIHLLEKIETEMRAVDPGKIKIQIQTALAFISRITHMLNCD